MHPKWFLSLFIKESSFLHPDPARGWLVAPARTCLRRLVSPIIRDRQQRVSGAFSLAKMPGFGNFGGWGMQGIGSTQNPQSIIGRDKPRFFAYSETGEPSTRSVFVSLGAHVKNRERVRETLVRCVRGQPF